jgi:NAD(P)H-binding
MSSKKLFMYVYGIAVQDGYKLIESRTGSTGYIGGSVLEGILKQYPDMPITALLRSPSAEFKTRYPNIEAVRGDFDAFDVIERAAAEADIVIRESYHESFICTPAKCS